MKTKSIAIIDIKVTNNHRSNIEETEIERMMQSIKQHGLMQAITVKPVGRGKFSVIAGHRRLLACQKLGHTTIEATIRTDAKEKTKHNLLCLTENIQRKDPTFSELGRGIDELIKEKMTFEQMEVRLGIAAKDLKKIYRTYSALPEKHRKHVKFMSKGKNDRDGGIPHSTATVLADVKKQLSLPPETFDKLIAHVIKNNLAKDVILNLATLMTYGLEIEDAFKKMEEYHVFHVEVVAPKRVVLGLLEQYKIKTSGALFRKIIYGQLSGIPKPSFIKKD